MGTEKKDRRRLFPGSNLPVNPDRNATAMAKLNVKNGTPTGNQHLCKSCSWGQFTTGFRESDVLVICTNTSPNIVVPFSVYECTEFSDKCRPDWEQMEKLAIQIQPAPFSKKTPGFNTHKVSQPVPRIVADEDEDEEDEAALVR
jgi:hypothetical protein